MFPQTDKTWRDYRALNQNWAYQPTLAGHAIILYVPKFPKQQTLKPIC